MVDGALLCVKHYGLARVGAYQHHEGLGVAVRQVPHAGHSEHAVLQYDLAVIVLALRLEPQLGDLLHVRVAGAVFVGEIRHCHDEVVGRSFGGGREDEPYQREIYGQQSGLRVRRWHR